MRAGEVAVEIAIEGVGAAGAALIDEDDVAVGAEFAVPDEDTDEFGGGLSRTAGEHDEGVGRARRGERGEDDDVEGDPASGLAVAIFPDGVGGAANLVGDAVQGAGMGFGFDGGGPSGRMRRGRRRGQGRRSGCDARHA